MDKKHVSHWNHISLLWKSAVFSDPFIHTDLLVTPTFFTTFYNTLLTDIGDHLFFFFFVVLSFLVKDEMSWQLLHGLLFILYTQSYCDSYITIPSASTVLCVLGHLANECMLTHCAVGWWWTCYTVSNKRSQKKMEMIFSLTLELSKCVFCQVLTWSKTELTLLKPREHRWCESLQAIIQHNKVK